MPPQWASRAWRLVRRILSIISGPGITILCLFLGVAIVREAFRDVVFLEPITVPQSYSDQGFSSNAVAQQLLDNINLVIQRAGSVVAAKRYDFGIGQMDLQIPGLGLSLRSVLAYIRRLVGIPDTKISGEIVNEHGGLRLRLRVSTIPGSYFDIEVQDTRSIEELLRLGAIQVVALIDPYMAAAYYSDIDSATAMTLAHDCMAREQSNCTSAANNLLGLIYVYKGNYSAAISLFEASIRANSSYAFAYKNLAAAHYLRGIIEQQAVPGLRAAQADYETAVNMYEMAIRVFEYQWIPRPARVPAPLWPTDRPVGEFSIAQSYESIARVEDALKGNPDAASSDGTTCHPADRWYALAAEAGYANAQKNLGDWYFGVCGGNDYRQALALYHQAASQEVTYALAALGLMYDAGEGIESPEPYSAAEWYFRAASHDFVKSQIWLGNMYLFGRGVQADAGQAYMWYLIASQGRADAIHLQSAASKAKRLGGLLTNEEKYRAAERARQWRCALADETMDLRGICESICFSWKQLQPVPDNRE